VRLSGFAPASSPTVDVRSRPTSVSVMSDSADNPDGHEPATLRDRMTGWPSALLFFLVGGLILVTGAVVIWMLVTTLGAILRTVF